MLLPIALDVAGKRCLVVGGGPVAARKVRSLVQCGAQVHVVAPHLEKELEAWKAQFEYSNRSFQSGDCRDCYLVFACTNEREINSQVVAEARQNGIWCNIADDAKSSDFYNVATIRRGEITITISTDGGSPALANHLRNEIKKVIGDEYAQLLQLMSERRTLLDRTATTQSERAILWHRVLESDVLELLRRGKREKAAQRVDEILAEPQA